MRAICLNATSRVPSILNSPPRAAAQTPEGLAPLGAALAADAVARSIPGLGGLLALITEPAGAAAGVAYLMTLVLSSPKVDPKTLAPAGTVLNAEKVGTRCVWQTRASGNVRIA